jgi:hypothetical protein
MSRWLLVVVLALSACSWEGKVKRLSSTEFTHYYALKPFMSDEERKAYLTLKTPEARDAWLKSNGCRDRLGKKECYWERFYRFDEGMRGKIVNGEVAESWTKEQVYMAWGAPFDSKSVAGRASPRSERLIYKFEKHEDGSVLVYEPGSETAYKAEGFFRREVIFDQKMDEYGVPVMYVAEILERPGLAD